MSREERRLRCEDHEAQHDSIELIANAVRSQGTAVARQDGQWRILMWGISLLAGAVLLFGVSVHNQTKTTHKLVNTMDKTFTVYMQSHTLESARGFALIRENDMAIVKNRQFIHGHEDRLKTLESRIH